MTGGEHTPKLPKKGLLGGLGKVLDKLPKVGVSKSFEEGVAVAKAEGSFGTANGAISGEVGKYAGVRGSVEGWAGLGVKAGASAKLEKGHLKIHSTGSASYLRERHDGCLLIG